MPRSGSRISRSLRLSHANFRTTTMRCCARSLPPPRPEAKQKCAIPADSRSPICGTDMHRSCFQLRTARSRKRFRRNSTCSIMSWRAKRRPLQQLPALCLEVWPFLQRLAVAVEQNSRGKQIPAHRFHLRHVHGADGAVSTLQKMPVVQRRVGERVLVRRDQRVACVLRAVDGEGVAGPRPSKKAAAACRLAPRNAFPEMIKVGVLVRQP